MSAKVDWLDKWDALYAERARASLALQAVPEGDNPEFEWLSGVFSGAMAPNPLLAVADWSDDNINLPSKGAAEPGPYRTARAPYARDPMNDCGVLSSVETVILMWGAQLGKALAIDTPIPTPAGWKRMGDLVAGDTVFDECGRPTRVLVAHPVMTDHRCIEVEFSDGAKIVCDEEHLWSVWDHSSGRMGRRWRTLRAGEMLPRHRRGKRTMFSIPVAHPLQIGERKLPVDPYVLGVWLGDGDSRGNNFTAHVDDLGHFVARVDVAGHSTASDDPKGNCKRVFIDKGVKSDDRFMVHVRALGLFGNKHIPAEYLRAGESQRWALLQGLMDTDGYAPDKGSCEFVSCDKPLADDFMELALSLGLKPSMKVKKTSCVYKGGRSVGRDAYIITFTAYSDQPVFSLPRKQARLTGRDGRRVTETTERRIIAMRYVDSVPVRCIGVDSPSRLFLCGREMIPTHNTQSLALNVVGYTMACNPGPILLVQPTVDAAKRFSQQRIQPMIEESKTLRAIVADTKSRDESNTMLLKSFMGGILILGGANSASALRSMPIATLVCDEISNYPLDVDGEGSPLALAKARTATFARRKIILTSTPATSGTCAVEAEYLNSDQRRYFVPCLQCGHMHTLDWANFVIPKDDQGNKLPEKAHMACPECGGVIEEHDKTLMLERGEWRATNPDYRDKKRRGYQLSSLYAPVGWRSWESVAREFLEAVGNPLKMKAFTNNVLGETFKDSGERRDPATLRGRAEEYGADGVLPDGVVLITAGIDLQMDRIEIQYVGWGRGEESWVLDHKILYGTPEGDDVWPLLDNAMRRQWVTGSGIALTVARGFMDTGGTGSVTARAYDYLKMRWGVMPIWGIKGQGGQGKPPVGSAAKTDSSKVPIYRLGVDALKESLYQRLTIEAPGPGFIHTPMSLPAGWYDQLVAEEIVTKHLKGFPVREWHKPSGKRNEALDTYVYAHAAMLSLALDLNAIADAIEGASTSQAPARRIRATMDA